MKSNECFKARATSDKLAAGFSGRGMMDACHNTHICSPEEHMSQPDKRWPFLLYETGQHLPRGFQAWDLKILALWAGCNTLTGCEMTMYIRRWRISEQKWPNWMNWKQWLWKKMVNKTSWWRSTDILWCSGASVFHSSNAGDFIHSYSAGIPSRTEHDLQVPT